MARPGLAVACVEALGDDFLGWLRRQRIEVVPISYSDTMRLGANLLALGNDRVVSTAACKEFNGRLRAIGIRVYDPEISIFTDGGGGPRCMSMALRRDPDKYDN